MLCRRHLVGFGLPKDACGTVLSPSGRVPSVARMLRVAVEPREDGACVQNLFGQILDRLTVCLRGCDGLEAGQECSINSKGRRAIAKCETIL